MSGSFSAKNRSSYIKQLKTEAYDLVVIGGGITGAGIALDATTRGLKVALIEKKDFAFGTSSRSTKLIHGGLRYLKQLEFGIVREVGQERAILYKNAPHIVIPEKMLLPIIQKGSLGKRSTSLGLYVYDKLAGVEKKERRFMLNKTQTLEKEPLLNETILRGGGMYVEYRSDDARLTIEVMKTAVENGAVCLNYSECVGFDHDANNKIDGVRVRDVLTNEEYFIKTKKVINAAGPWVDTLRDIDNSLKGKRLHLTKGVHLVVSKNRLPIQNAVYFDVEDGRMIFAIPRASIVYLGTTDTNYAADKDQPYADKNDVEYILNACNNMFPSVHLTKDDVISTWAGLRPLIHEDGKSPSDLSRKDEIFISNTNLISIAGGKLTGFRKMAQRSVDVVCNQLRKEEGRKFVECKTKHYQLSGGNLGTESIEDYARRIQLECKCFDLDDVLALVQKYGSNTPEILHLGEEKTNKDLLLAEALYSIENELSVNIADFLIRRSGRVYFERPNLEDKIETLHQFFTEQLNTTTTNADEFKADFMKEYLGVVQFKN